MPSDRSHLVLTTAPSASELAAHSATVETDGGAPASAQTSRRFIRRIVRHAAEALSTTDARLARQVWRDLDDRYQALARDMLQTARRVGPDASEDQLVEFVGERLALRVARSVQ